MTNENTLGAAVITQNHENYIEESIEALLAQTHRISNILVIDDHSDDSTFSKVQKYAQKYSFVTCLRNREVLGPSATSNLALDYLENDYILYTSGDDISHRNRAFTQLEYFKQNPKLTCVINGVKVFTDDETVNLINLPQFRYSNLQGLKLFKELYWKENFLNASASCFRKSHITQKLFDNEFLYLQDYKLWMNLCMNNTVIVGEELVLDYRVTSASLSQKVNKNNLDSKFKMIEELFDINSKAIEALNLPVIIELFCDEISKYQKSDIRKIDKQSLIFFLLMSHNNPGLRLKALQSFRKMDIYPRILEDLKENFFLSKQTLDKIEL